MGGNRSFPPTMFVNNQKFQYEGNLSKMSAFLDSRAANMGNGRKLSAVATMKNAGHMSQSDAPIMFGSLMWFLGFRPSVCPALSLSLNARVCHSFLDRIGVGPYTRTAAPVDGFFMREGGRHGPEEALPDLVEIQVFG